MHILEKRVVKQFGDYFVIEGTVILEGQGEVNCYWVEDSVSHRKSSFTDIDTASSAADMLAKQDSHGNADSDNGGHAVDSNEGDGDSGGNGGD